MRNALFCIVLALASAAGMPMRPDEVEELMQAMNQPKVAHTLQDEEWAGAPANPERPPESS
jgi:hypothetical protein